MAMQYLFHVKYPIWFLDAYPMLYQYLETNVGSTSNLYGFPIFVLSGILGTTFAPNIRLTSDTQYIDILVSDVLQYLETNVVIIQFFFLVS